MNKEIISNRQGIILVILFIFGSTLVIGTAGEAKKDLWLAVLISIIYALPVLMAYVKLLCMFPRKDIFDILKLVFGNLLGKIISLLFIWYALHLGSLVLYNFSEFVGSVGLNQTPKLVFMSSFMLICVWGVKAGIEVIGRCAEILFTFFSIIMILSTLLSFSNVKLRNLLPVLENGIRPVLTGAFSGFAFPLGETVIFLMIFSCLQEKKSVFKSFIFGLLITGGALVFLGARNIAVLGSHIASLVYYPEFNIIARINIGHFFQRLESAVSIVFVITGFFKISMCLLGASKGISKLFNIEDYRFIVIPTALIILNLGFFVTKDIMELRNWNRQIYPYYAFIFQVILPIIVLISAKIRYKKINKDLSNV